MEFKCWIFEVWYICSVRHYASIRLLEFCANMLRFGYISISLCLWNKPNISARMCIQNCGNGTSGSHMLWFSAWQLPPPSRG